MEEFILVDRNTSFTEEEKNKLQYVSVFFSSNSKYITTMLSIINGESKVSIRVIDWFVSNYSNRHSSTYILKIKGIEDSFDVNSRYKMELRKHTKKYFDPFCRVPKLFYNYKDVNGKNPVTFMTSIGQLNFFMWALKHKVIDYVTDKNHLEMIENDMRRMAKLNKERKKAFDESIEKIRNEQSEESDDDAIDPDVCSSDSLTSIVVGSQKKKPIELKLKRQHISNISKEYEITKLQQPITLGFD